MPSHEFEIFYQSIKSKTPKAGQSPAELRDNFEMMMAAFPCADDIQTENIFVGNIPAIWYIAPQAIHKKALLFFHAGGYTAGSPHSHRDLLGRISRESGAMVLAISYRLAPENPFPEAFEDALYAYEWLSDHLGAESIILSGLSAGGGLVLALLLYLKLNKKPLPAGGICLCPWVDLTMKSASIHLNDGKDILSRDRLEVAAKMYLHGQDPKNIFVSPLYGDLTELPPLLIQTGSLEILYDEALELAQIAKECSVNVTLERYKEMFHAWQLFAAKIPEGKEAIKKIGLFVQKLMN